MKTFIQKVVHPNLFATFRHIHICRQSPLSIDQRMRSIKRKTCSVRTSLDM